MKSILIAAEKALALAALAIVLGCTATSGNRPTHPAGTPGGSAASSPTPSSSPEPIGQSSGSGNAGTAAGVMPPKRPPAISDASAINQANQAGRREAELDKTRAEIMGATRSIQAAGRKVDFATVLEAGNAPAGVKPDEAGFAEYVTTRCDKPELLSAMLAALRAQQ